MMKLFGYEFIVRKAEQAGPNQLAAVIRHYESMPTNTTAATNLGIIKAFEKLYASGKRYN
jgi:hypothetical protein